MRVLLDTHIALWMALADKRLPAKAHALLADRGTTRLFSAASAWEIAVKWRLGKLPLPEHPRVWINLMVGELLLENVAIRYDHAIQAADLPDHHRDPFDRILIAQAQVEKIPIVTADPAFDKYDIDILPRR